MKQLLFIALCTSVAVGLLATIGVMAVDPELHAPDWLAFPVYLGWIVVTLSIKMLWLHYEAKDNADH